MSEYIKYASLSRADVIEIKEKHGIDIFNQNCPKKVIKCINSYYKKRIITPAKNRTN